MDFSRKQYDSLSLRYYRGVISHKEILYEKDQLKINYVMFEEQNVIFKIYIIKMVKLLQGIWYYATVIENNRILCQTYCLTIGYCSLD